MAYRAIVLLLFLPYSYAGSDGSDDQQALIQLLHAFRANVYRVISDSGGYERLHHVVNKSSEVLEFYGFVGHLFRNGTLGRCLDQKNGSLCDIYVNRNSSKFSKDLAVFWEKESDDNGFKDDETFLDSFIPKTGLERISLMRVYVKKMFEKTWDFYYYLQDIVRFLLQAGFADDVYDTDLRSKCRGFHAAQIVDEGSTPSDVSIKFLVDVMGPGCTTNATSSTSAALQSISENYAKKFNFGGGTSNRCFQNFVIRYNNYSADVYERFVGNVSRYLYQDTVLHGLCLSFDKNGRDVSETERSRRKDWVKRKLTEIGNSLMESRSVLEEKLSTDLQPQRTAPWSNQTKAVLEDAIGTDIIPYPSSENDLNRYKAIYERIQAGLAKIMLSSSRRSGISPTFDVLVYSPSADSTNHCVTASKPVLSGYFMNVNYVVSLGEEAFPSWIREKNATIQKYYSESDESDLCKRIEEVSSKMSQKLVGPGALSAVVAVKCARMFVWYELSYQYFPGIYTEAPTVEAKPESSFNSNCGHIVLFP